MEYTTEIYNHLETQLNEIELEAANVLDEARQSYHAVEAALKKIREFIADYTFENPAEEIRFFKEIKPKFYSKLIYYVRLFETETNRPQGSVKSQKKYFLKRLATIKRYSEDNQTFYKYYRSGASYMDGRYFLRDKVDLLIGFDVSYFDGDPQFCTSHDYALAMLLANEEMVKYLNRSLQQLAPAPDHQQTESLLQELSLGWADSKAAFIELLYALQTAGVFYNTKNKSRADIKQIARFFELALGIELGNYYRTFQEIRIRKKGRTSFLDRIREMLIRRMDDTDDNFN